MSMTKLDLSAVFQNSNSKNLEHLKQMYRIYYLCFRLPVYGCCLNTRS